MLEQIKKFHIVLIKPSKYDDDGYVIRFWKGVLPSNTLNVLHGLTEDIKTRGVFEDLPIEVTTFDETAEKVPMSRIIRWSKASGTKLLICLVGVQTNQFPRALDMARIFKAEGITVIMGGFHTSGTINMLSDQEPDIQELYREGICMVSGEVEGKWEGILGDFLNGQLKPLYSFAQDLQNLVDIEEAPLPQTSAKTMKHFAYPSFATADTSRGCPFACTFCTIINVQGRKMRERSPQSIAAMMRRNYVESGLSFYFFTDDNFARKKLWRETFEEIIKLREEGLDVSFMMQVDLAKKPKEFVPLAAKAGCTQVFIGMESVSPYFALYEPIGITARSSRNTTSARRAATMPMPNWLAPIPSMMVMFAYRTSRSIRCWTLLPASIWTPPTRAEDQRNTSDVPCSPRTSPSTDAGVTSRCRPR